MKIAVLKISGKALDDFLSNKSRINAIQKIKNDFDGIVIVHGAGTTISDWSKALGLEIKFHEGQRVTTREVMDVVAAVQAGMLNTKIVSMLNAENIPATGLSGVDRNTFVAEYLEKNLGFVGYPKENASVEWIKELMHKNILPVFSSVCRDAEGNLMNVNADLFTEVMASALKADSVFFLSDVNGVILDGSIQSKLSASQINEGIVNGEITGGMIPKLQSCVELMNNGINKIWIGSKIWEDLLNDKSHENFSGTWIVQSVC